VEQVEQCDDGDRQFTSGEYCSAVCALVPCGGPTNPNASTPTASDALFALQAAVGQLACDVRVCDVNGDATVATTDALLILKKAVGAAVALNCPV
jgi:hypothetical protein